ncbi:MAG TPA: tetratricopeptide repeat protein, partial [Thermoanaerobaculia bacterium]
MKPWVSRILSFLAFAGTIAGAAELPKAYSPEAQAVREAAALRRQGDQLQEQGRAEEAREAWRKAIEAYRRAGYPAGEGEVLFQIGVSHQAEMMVKPGAMNQMLGAMAEGTTVLAEFLDGVAREAGSRSSSAAPEAEVLLGQASRLTQTGDCMGALPLFEAAGRRYSAGGPSTGELRALAGRLRCLQIKEDDPLSAMAFLTTLQEFMRIAQELQGQLKAGPAVRYLRAAESAELGRWQEAETLLRSLLPELEAVGDVVGANRTALDLGCVLVRQGKPAEAEPLLKRAREAFAGWNEAACQPQPALPPEPQIVDAAVPQQPPLPEPAGLSPRARARREGAFLLGKGDRLAEAGRLAAAREAWKAAAEASRQAAEPWNLSEAYLRLGGSYASSTVMDASQRWLFLDYYEQALTAQLEAYEADVRDEVDIVRQIVEIRSLFREARSRALSGDFVGAMDATVRALP